MVRPTLACLVGFALARVVAAADFDAASATNQVGLDLFRQLATKQPDGNLVLSPYSIESALALVYAGADGVTRSEMASALQFPTDDASLVAGLGGLRHALDRVSADSVATAESISRSGARVDPIQWNAANRLFGQVGEPLRDSFFQLMREGAAAPFEAMNFRGNAEASRAKINSWVEDTTHQKIRDLIPAGALTADTRLVLVNALYLKAPWQQKFAKAATLPRPFRNESGGVLREVPTMQRTAPLRYAKEEGLTVVALDYLGGSLQFLILLPDEGRSLEAIASKITADDFLRWGKSDRAPRPTSIALFLPKFRVEGKTLPLGQALRGIGVKSAFDEPRGSANFNRMAQRSGTNYLLLSDVFHQTFIALDEEGTEAAAATAASMALAASAVKPVEPIEVHVDRPFLFAIQHRASGTCLFVGRITDPR
ncbi:MAG: serpin family protein [Opitutaceae bacterium]